MKAQKMFKPSQLYLNKNKKWKDYSRKYNVDNCSHYMFSIESFNLILKPDVSPNTTDLCHHQTDCTNSTVHKHLYAYAKYGYHLQNQLTATYERR